MIASIDFMSLCLPMQAALYTRARVIFPTGYVLLLPNPSMASCCSQGRAHVHDSHIWALSYNLGFPRPRPCSYTCSFFGDWHSLSSMRYSTLPLFIRKIPRLPSHPSRATPPSSLFWFCQAALGTPCMVQFSLHRPWFIVHTWVRKSVWWILTSTFWKMN